MEVPNKKTSAVVSALMVVAALVGVGIGLLCGNFGIKPDRGTDRHHAQPPHAHPFGH